MTDAYSQLLDRLQRAHHLHSIAGLLGWDEQVNLPPNSADIRGEQMALMAELVHEALSDPRIGALLEELEGAAAAGGLTEDQHVVVSNARRDYDRVARLPAAFVNEKARHSSASYHAWTRAKAANDFASYAPYIEKHIALAKQEIASLSSQIATVQGQFTSAKSELDQTRQRVATGASNLARILPLERAVAQIERERKELDSAILQRVHRSTIVNVKCVRQMQAHINGEYFLTLNSGHTVKLSRSYKDKLRHFS